MMLLTYFIIFQVNDVLILPQVGHNRSSVTLTQNCPLTLYYLDN